ncbi:hypothetical protein ACE193_16485 [Bernardetia sp. OM2101]|uniref:hypothetical protein n=1 Tax=Bernardetia sp. OM2101 TaxID=3344876 RepID=UPI0035CFD56F
MTIYQLLQDFYVKNTIPLDGGANDNLLPINLGFVKFTIYNPTWRRKVVHIHDIEHVLCDCDTSWKGESFVAGYEMGVGFYKIFPICLFVFFAMGYSLWLYPKRVWEGFVEGLKNKNLLDLNMEKEELMNLEKTVLQAKIRKTENSNVTLTSLLKFFVLSLISQILLFSPVWFFVILWTTIN